jgi:hypothetical protein
MSECDCCGYDGTDLPRYRDLMRDVLDNMVDKRTAELHKRIALLEAVAEEAEMLVMADNKADNYVDFTDLEQYLYAAGYLKEC